MVDHVHGYVVRLCGLGDLGIQISIVGCGNDQLEPAHVLRVKRLVDEGYASRVSKLQDRIMNLRSLHADQPAGLKQGLGLASSYRSAADDQTGFILQIEEYGQIIHIFRFC